LNRDRIFLINLFISIVSWEQFSRLHYNFAAIEIKNISHGSLTHADVFEVEFEGFKVEFVGFKVEFDPFIVPPAPAASAVPLEPGLLELPAAAVRFSDPDPGNPAGLVEFPVALAGLPEASPPEILY